MDEGNPRSGEGENPSAKPNLRTCRIANSGGRGPPKTGGRKIKWGRQMEHDPGVWVNQVASKEEEFQA